MAASPARLTSALAAAVHAACSGTQVGGNPRVGCVLLDSAGNTVAVGHHRGAGSPHAEVDALSQVADPRGCEAVVTLEPCAHEGRTGPCAAALIDAGVSRVVYAVADPTAEAAGGAPLLRAAGIEVLTARQAGIEASVIASAERVSASWRAARVRNRPWVIAKAAMTSDGFVAAADGSSQWITGRAARAHAHTLRADVDAIAVGTSTALADNPSLTARDEHGRVVASPARYVLGRRALPAEGRLEQAGYVRIPSHDPAELLDHCRGAGHWRVLIEGGPTVISAALAAGLVDEWHCYVAPVLLGAGRRALGDLGVTRLSQALTLEVIDRIDLAPDQLTTFAVSKEAIDVYRTR